MKLNLKISLVLLPKANPPNTIMESWTTTHECSSLVIGKSSSLFAYFTFTIDHVSLYKSSVYKSRFSFSPELPPNKNIFFSKTTELWLLIFGGFKLFSENYSNCHSGLGLYSLSLGCVLITSFRSMTYMLLSYPTEISLPPKI